LPIFYLPTSDTTKSPTDRKEEFEGFVDEEDKVEEEEEVEEVEEKEEVVDDDEDENEAVVTNLL
jgi:hypothetical protein